MESKSLKEQIEYYFGDENYPHDKYLRKQANAHGCTLALPNLFPLYYIIYMHF
jgi:hypothetical protein